MTKIVVSPALFDTLRSQGFLAEQHNHDGSFWGVELDDGSDLIECFLTKAHTIKLPVNTKPLDWQDVEKLKSDGRFYHAGALAYILGRDNDYGCHFGMSSTRSIAIAQFKDGWDNARIHNEVNFR